MRTGGRTGGCDGIIMREIYIETNMDKKRYGEHQRATVYLQTERGGGESSFASALSSRHC